MAPPDVERPDHRPDAEPDGMRHIGRAVHGRKPVSQIDRRADSSGPHDPHHLTGEEHIERSGRRPRPDRAANIGLMDEIWVRAPVERRAERQDDQARQHGAEP